MLNSHFMTKSLITIILVLLSYFSFTQISITVSSRGTKKFNSVTKTFEVATETVFDNSIFILNKNEDMLLHKASEYNRTYYLTFKEKDGDIYVYDSVDDRGIYWTIFFDYDKDLLKFMLTSNGEIGLVIYSIKSVF